MLGAVSCSEGGRSLRVPFHFTIKHSIVKASGKPLVSSVSLVALFFREPFFAQKRCSTVAVGGAVYR